MPLQKPYRGQDAATQPPIRRRAPVLVVLLMVVVLAAVAIPYAALQGDGPSKLRAGCVEVTAASSTGGATFSACGQAAARLCHAQATRDGEFARTVQASCRRAGYP